MSHQDASESARLLRRLARGLEKREALHSGAAREGLDVHLVKLVETLKSQVQQTMAQEGGGRPSRGAALAFAAAVYSQPHLPITLHDRPSQGTHDIRPPALPDADPPLVFSQETLREVFHLEDWEFDELREEVDRRVGRHLKQERALEWLWHHFKVGRSDPERFFRVLFPAAPRRLPDDVGMIRYGSQLYALVDQNPPPPLASLYLGWLDVDPETTYDPLETFGGRYVDGGLRRLLGRAIGASDAEVIDLLDRMVTIIPRRNCAAYIVHDMWRITGAAAMTDIGASYASGGWHARPLAANELYVKEFLGIAPSGRLTVKDALPTFDRHATHRASTMLNQLHAEMLARTLIEDPSTPAHTTAEDLSLYDLKRHLRKVLLPLLDWARAEETVNHVAKVFKVRDDEARNTLLALAKAWQRRAETYWWGSPSREQAFTVRGALLMHFISTHTNLRLTLRRRSGPRRRHQDLLHLFAAHYYAEASIGRLLAEMSGPEPKTDPIAHWFWVMWQQLMNRDDSDVESTWSGPTPLR
ncbi:MAG: hypothetical protein JRI25_05500 [Deltaproteobacteria bacterium]|nr:hypothetical protein [Deltaproteobacteria bacterium]MBW2254038.1 hypothetical protein [Deltaproteobacteria bacterium]